MSERPLPNADGEAPSRFVVGIDLGTTNSAVAYVDTQQEPWQVATLPILQVVAPFQAEQRETLPSFHYQTTSAEANAGAVRLPWSAEAPSHAVGVFARDEGTGNPGRLVASAKSWLSHTGVDRTADLLPWHGDADVERLSPVEASSRYLRHLHENWNAAFPNHPLAEQDVVVTLPASFDEVARQLTIEAAKRAGLPRIILIEEPQAAFYAWVYRNAVDWQQQITSGQKILVCDVGGGTSDFTLIRVSANETTGHAVFNRIAVGEHLILGGDNLDLALARYVEQKLAGDDKLPAHQWEVLVRTARRVKETLLGENPPETITINLPAAGAKLIGGGLQTAVTRAEVESLLLDGFLPRVNLTDKPARKQSGFQDFGLPYATDPAITRYLAAFLSAHRFTGDETLGSDRPAGQGADPARPDVVLLNGGLFASPVLQQRLLEVVASWFSSPEQSWRPAVLESPRLDLAVAHGAAYYGMVRRGEGVSIAATLARSYYIGVASDKPTAVCLAPGNAVAGQEFEIEGLDLQVTLAEPVEFPLYVSSSRLVDPPGAIIEVNREELTPLPPIRTVLKSGRQKDQQQAKVRLRAQLSEIGVLELSCREVDANRSWRLQFDIRSTTQTDLAAHDTAGEREGFVDEPTLAACRERIAGVFAESGGTPPRELMPELVRALELDKHEWPTSALRRLWEMLMEFQAGRQRSPAHEARWLNLVGYSLRPGYGFAVDDWRVAQTWRAVNGKIAFPASHAETLILWRRIAGGLSRGQQLGLAEPLIASVRALRRRFDGGAALAGTTALDPAATLEIWRLLGSLELLPINLKLELGDHIVHLLPKRKLENARPTMIWALGRLGQRVPLSGPLNTVVPVQQAAKWLDAILARPETDLLSNAAVMQLARRTDDRHRDVDAARRARIVEWLEFRDAAEHLIELVRTGGALDEGERGVVYGESMPIGLRIHE
ncbi:hsp70 family protein [Lacipirellula parvula]|uniref:hsp70 family protein n=1 Tax=Lacipirellula parvula TaxID=2650471 RepID=UPI001260FFE6|nr:hsp70 family protein [Lacipirellula parvula]